MKPAPEAQGGEPCPSPTGRRIVLTAIGSLGDVHPYIAIALGLKARGHEAVVATGEYYRRKVESLGLGYRPLRPDSDFVADPAVFSRFMDYRWGTFRILRERIVPAIRQSFEDTMAAADGGTDLLVSHPITYATRLVAEKTGIPWVSTQVTPVGLFSAHDPPLPPGFPDLADRLRFLGPWFWWPLGRTLVRATRAWADPILRLRSEIGLPPSSDNPLVEGHSPAMVLALFSKILADLQPDWPPRTIHTGFPIHDRDGGRDKPPDLVRFLDDGPPPIVFTLSASASMVAGSFFEESIEAARKLGRRAILITGKSSSTRRAALPDGVVAFDYVPFSEVFPRASVVVHAGGIGTTGLAMRSGRPMLVVPHAHDQPDNAARLARLGVSRTISPARYRSARVEAELRHLLEDPEYSRKASEIGERVRRENGVRTACDALEAMLPGVRRS